MSYRVWPRVSNVDHPFFDSAVSLVWIRDGRIAAAP